MRAARVKLVGKRYQFQYGTRVLSQAKTDKTQMFSLTLKNLL